MAVALAAALVPYLAGRAHPHASYVSSTPSNNEQLTRPPTRVVMHFSEAIERKLTQIQVLDCSKSRVDTNDIAFDNSDPTFASVGVKDIGPGLYFVKWSNVSAVDGHNLDGQFPFVVLNADGSFPNQPNCQLTAAATESGGSLLPAKTDAALKWLSLLSLAIVTGAGFFLFVGMRPAAAFLEEKDYASVIDMVERWVISMAHVLLPIAFIASAFLLFLQVHRFATDTSLWSYVTTVKVGQYHLARLLLILVALAACDLLLLGRSRMKRNIAVVVLIVAGLAALFTYSEISHASADKGRFWAVGSDYIHLVASAAWLGALTMILLFLRWRRHALDDASRFLYIANVFDRFSVVAALSVAAILATGTFNGLAAVPTAGAMIHTTYGRVLLVKIGLLMPLLAVAGLNAFVLKPRFVAAIDSLYQQGGTTTEAARARWTPQLRRLRELLVPTVIVEIALIVAIFAVVGVLTQSVTAGGERASQKAAHAAPEQFQQQVTAGGLKIGLTVSPNRVGLNEYDLSVKKPDGTPADTVTLARLRFTYTDVANAVAPSEVTLNRLQPGQYKSAGAYFTSSGNWRVDLTLRRSDGDDVSQSFVLPVAPPPATTTGSGSAFALPFTVFTWNEVVGAALALIGALILVYRRQFGFQNVGYRATVTGATGILLAGAVLVFGVHSNGAVGSLTKGNPVPANAQSVAAGKKLFQDNCVTCHGPDGRGDGPAAANLNPKPSDFRLHMPLHTDPQFYTFIHDGYPGTAMPAFKSAFSANDIWNLVNFLRSAFGSGSTQ
jgi:copper transport protein